MVIALQSHREKYRKHMTEAYKIKQGMWNLAGTCVFSHFKNDKNLKRFRER